MLWLIGAAAAAGLFLWNRSRQIPLFVTQPNGVVAFNYENLPDREEYHATITSYGRTAEGKLDDGTMWVEGEYGKAVKDPSSISIYKRALELGGPSEANLRWIMMYRQDLEQMANYRNEGDPFPKKIKLFIVDPKFVIESGMAAPGSTMVYYG